MLRSPLTFLALAAVAQALSAINEVLAFNRKGLLPGATEATDRTDDSHLPLPLR